MFDTFSIFSGHLSYFRTRSDGDDDDWLIETKTPEVLHQGTAVWMTISTSATQTASEVFSKYQDDDYLFTKTHVPVALSRYPGEQLVSRSQAKRVLTRFEKFSEVSLDFQGVQEIGQAFADEIFRVFRNSHPETKVLAFNTSPAIDRMISHVQGGAEKHKESTL